MASPLVAMELRVASRKRLLERPSVAPTAEASTEDPHLPDQPVEKPDEPSAATQSPPEVVCACGMEVGKHNFLFALIFLFLARFSRRPAGRD